MGARFPLAPLFQEKCWSKGCPVVGLGTAVGIADPIISPAGYAASKLAKGRRNIAYGSEPFAPQELKIAPPYPIAWWPQSQGYVSLKGSGLTVSVAICQS